MADIFDQVAATYQKPDADIFGMVAAQGSKQQPDIFDMVAAGTKDAAPVKISNDLIPTPISPNPGTPVDDYKPSLIERMGAGIDRMMAPIAEPISRYLFSGSTPPNPKAATPAIPSIPDVGQTTQDGYHVPTAADSKFQGNELDLPGYIDFKAFGPSNEQVTGERRAALDDIAARRPVIGMPVEQPLLAKILDAGRDSDLAAVFIGPSDRVKLRDSVKLANGEFAYKPAGNMVDKLGLTPALGPENPNVAATNIPHFGPQDNAVDQISAGIMNNAIDLVNFSKSPLGLLTMGVGGMGEAASPVVATAVKALQRGVSGGFAADMGSGIPEQAKQFKEAEGLQDTVQSGVGLGSTLLFAGGAAKHAAQGRLLAKAGERINGLLSDERSRLSQDVSRADLLNDPAPSPDNQTASSEPESKPSLELPPGPIINKQPSVAERIREMSDAELAEKHKALSSMVNEAAVNATHSDAPVGEREFAEQGQGLLDSLQSEIDRRKNVETADAGIGGDVKSGAKSDASLPENPDGEQSPQVTQEVLTPAQKQERIRSSLEVTRHAARPDAPPEERRAALEGMYPVEIDTTPLSEAQDWKGLRDRARNILRTLRDKGPVTTTDGRNVTLTMRGQKEVESHSLSNDAVLRVTPNLRTLIARAVPLWSEPDTHNRPDVKGFHNYGVKVSIDGVDHYVRLVIREDANGSFHYDHDVSSIEEITKNPERPSALPIRNRVPGISPDANKLRDWWNGVNKEAVPGEEATVREADPTTGGEPIPPKPPDASTQNTENPDTKSDGNAAGKPKISPDDLDRDLAHQENPNISKEVAPANSPRAAEPELSKVPDEQAGDNPPRTTGLKKAVVKEERLQRGLEDLPASERQAEEERVARAVDHLKENAESGKKLVSGILDEGRHEISPDDAALLLAERNRVMNRRAALDEELANADTSKERRETVNKELEGIEEEIDRLDQAQRASGESWGRLGHLYQRLIREDYSLAGMERKMRVAKGGPLTEPERADIKAKSERIDALEKEIAEKTKDNEDLQSQLSEQEAISQAYEETIRDIKQAKRENPKFKQEVFDRARAKVEEWKADAEEAHKELRKLLGQANMGVDPRILAPIVRIARAHISEAGLSFAEFSAKMIKAFGEKVKPVLRKAWVQAQQEIKTGISDIQERNLIISGKTMSREGTVEQARARAKARRVAGDELSHKEVYDVARAHIHAGVHGEDAVIKATHATLKEIYPELTERDVRRAFSEYGKAKFPSKEADKKELAELRRLTQLQESIDRLNEGLPALKTGLQRDKATQAIREKQKQLNELLKKVKLPSSQEKLVSNMEARKTALRNSIEDLDKQLRSGEKPPGRSAPPPLDAEGERLKAERDAMRDYLHELERKENPGPSPADAQVERLERIRERLDEVLRGGREPDKAKAFEALSSKAEDLKMEIDAMRELAAQMRRDAKPKADPNAAKEQAQIRALEAAIARYDEKLAAGDFGPASKGAPRPDTQKVAAARELLEARKQAYEAAKKASIPVKSPDERYNETRQKQVTKRIADIEERIAKSDYSKPVKKTSPAKNQGTLDLEYTLQKAKEEFDRGVLKAQLAQRNAPKRILDGIGESVGLMRAFKSTLDFSAVLRQGLPISLANLEKLPAGFRDMFKATWSEKNQFAIMKAIEEMPYARFYKQAKLYLNDPRNLDLRKMEEAYRSRWATKAPIAGHLVAASERAYVTFLNKMRADVFNKLCAQIERYGGTLNKSTLEELGKLVNDMSGRGTWGKYDAAMDAANLGLFSARLMASRASLAVGGPVWRALYRGVFKGEKNPALTKVALSQMLKMYGGIATLFFISKTLSDKKEYDFRSTDASKMIKGNTRIDLTGGIGTYVTLLSRLATGKTKELNGKVHPNRGDKVPYGAKNGAGLIWNFARSKFNPALGSVMNLVSGEDVTGQPTDWKNELKQAYIPMSYNDVTETLNAHRDNPGLGTALATLAIFGAGINNIKPKKTTSRASW